METGYQPRSQWKSDATVLGLCDYLTWPDLTPPLFNPNFGGVPVAPDRRCWASMSTWTLSYLAVKLFSKNSNLCDHDTWSSRTDGQTDGQTDRRLTVALPRSGLASRGKNLHTLKKLAQVSGNSFWYQILKRSGYIQIGENLVSNTSNKIRGVPNFQWVKIKEKVGLLYSR